MGDRVMVTLRFGGKVTKAVLDELWDTLDGRGFVGEAEGKTTKDRCRILSEGIDCHEVNYADTSDVDDLCTENHIDMIKTHEAGGGYGAGYIVIFDGKLREFAGGDDGPMVAYSEILKIENLASGWAALIADARLTARELDPLEVVG